MTLTRVRRRASWWADLRTLYALTLAPVRGRSHAERLESFYARQAESYDDFRRRLLHGREELLSCLEVRPGQVWVDLGGGTASNLEFLGDRLQALGEVHVVDLSASLLDVGIRRAKALGWKNVRFHSADAATFRPDRPVDVVICSYSLSMMPSWRAVIDRAFDAMRPGGLLGAVDYYVASHRPQEGWRRHSWATRTLWPRWFGLDGVRLSPDLPRRLHEKFQPCCFREATGTVPFLLGLRAPYFVFVGSKPT